MPKAVYDPTAARRMMPVTAIDEAVKIFAFHSWHVAQQGAGWVIFEHFEQHVLSRKTNTNKVVARGRVTVEPDGQLRLKLERPVLTPGYALTDFKRAAKQLRAAGLALKWP